MKINPSGRALLSGLLVSCGLLLPAPALTGAADPSVAATWGSGVVADGSTGDWPRLERIGDGPGIAVQNDADNLYLAVASDDEVVRMQLATGLMVWFDGTGRKTQSFGVRLEGLSRRPLPGATPDADAKGLLDQHLALNTFEEFDLLGPARNQRRLIDDPALVGMTLASGVETGTIVYELKLPLRKTEATPHAVGATPGATIAIGFETPADPTAARQRNRLDNPTSTYPRVFDPYGGYYTNQPPPPSGSSRAPKEVVIKPMKLMWTLVRLAVPPASAPK